MQPAELEQLAHFVAEREPEPRPRLFLPVYSEILNLVRLLLFPGGWLPNPTTNFADPGPVTISVEYPSLREGWHISFHYSGFDPEHPTNGAVVLQFLPLGSHGQGLPVEKIRLGLARSHTFQRARPGARGLKDWAPPAGPDWRSLKEPRRGINQ